MACHPCFWNSGSFSISASKVVSTWVLPCCSANNVVALRPSGMVYVISLCSSTLLYTPSKSKPKLPSFASIRFLNLPPVRRSFSLLGVCQLGSAAFHCIISLGVFHIFQTFSTGACTVASTVILVTCAIAIRFLLVKFTIQNYGRISDYDSCKNDN